MNAAQWANTVASGMVAVCAGVFIGTYHRYAPWRSTPVGRQLMMVASAIGALGLYTVLITLWPEGCTAVLLRAVRTAVVLSTAVLMLRQARMVQLAQRVDRAERLVTDEEDPDA